MSIRGGKLLEDLIDQSLCDERKGESKSGIGEVKFLELAFKCSHLRHKITIPTVTSISILVRRGVLNCKNIQGGDAEEKGLTML